MTKDDFTEGNIKKNNYLKKSVSFHVCIGQNYLSNKGSQV